MIANAQREAFRLLGYRVTDEGLADEHYWAAHHRLLETAMRFAKGDHRRLLDKSVLRRLHREQPEPAFGIELETPK